MDGSDGFYHIFLRRKDSPMQGLVFPLEGDYGELVSITLTLPIGWKNSQPIFCTGTETVGDLANAYLRYNTPALPHKLDDMTESIVREALPTFQLVLTGLTRDQYLSRANSKSAAYIDVFVDDFLEIAQGPSYRRRRVRKTL